MPPHPREDDTDDTPDSRPWGTHYAAVTTSSTNKPRTFVDGLAFIERDGREGLSWQHIEDVSAYDEYDLENYTTRIREEGYYELFSASGSAAAAYEDECDNQSGSWGFTWETDDKDGDAQEGGFKKGMFGFGNGVKSEGGYMRSLFRSVQERGAKGVSNEAKEGAGSSTEGGFGAGVKGKGKGPAGKK